LVLICNIPLINISIVQEVYNDWRLRTRIEHGYRFDQEQGLDVEDMRVHTMSVCAACLQWCCLPLKSFSLLPCTGRQKLS